jgi:CRP-like cAMP-binding protein
MSLPKDPGIPSENRLLASLPRKDYERLLPKLEPVSLEFKAVLAEPDKPAAYVYFPKNGVVSLITYMADGAGTEVGIVGNEGMAGISIFLGSGREPGKVFCQVPGEALRMKAKALREETRGGSPLNEILLRYTQALLIQVSQSTACNRLHTAEERLCRWLLMTHDRVGADQFQITQDFMADMLGLRRPTVSLVASTVQKAGLIRYSRGKMAIVDRTGLEAASCECYAKVKEEFDRLLG